MKNCRFHSTLVSAIGSFDRNRIQRVAHYLLILLVATTAVSAQEVFIDGSVSAFNGANDSVKEDLEVMRESSTVEDGPIDDSVSISGPFVTERGSFQHLSSIEASSSFGLIQLKLKSRKQHPSILGFSYTLSRVRVGWNDHITVFPKDPALTGKQVVVTYRLKASGSMAVQLTNPHDTDRTYSEAFYSIQVGVFGVKGVRGDGESRVINDSFPLTADFELPVTLGGRKEIRVDSLAAAQTSSNSNPENSSFNAEVDLRVEWGGVTGIRSADGTALTVSDFTSTSSSGFDYLGNGPPPPTDPEPEPTNGIQWNNSAGGSFAAAANWDPEQVPGINDTAIFGLQEDYTVNASVGADTHLVERLLIGGDPLTTVRFDNANLRAQSTSLEKPSIQVDHGVFSLHGGTLSSNHAVIGSNAQTHALVLGDDTMWDNAGRITIGAGGEAELDILDGATLRSPEVVVGAAGNGAPGTLFLDKEGSSLKTTSLQIGTTGPGEVSIEREAVVILDPSSFPDLADNFSPSVVVGSAQGAMGRLVLKEEGELNLIDPTGEGEVSVGAGTGGNGHLLLEAGGGLTAPNLRVGNNGSFGLVEVRGIHELYLSQINLEDPQAGEMIIAGTSDVDGKPTRLLIEEGGVVTCRTAKIGNHSTGQIPLVGRACVGKPLLDGEEVFLNSRWDILDELTIQGLEGTQLEVLDGGRMSVGNFGPFGEHLVGEADSFEKVLEIAGSSGSYGSIKIDNTSQIVTSPKVISAGERGTGELVIVGGALQGAGTLNLGAVEPANFGSPGSGIVRVSELGLLEMGETGYGNLIRVGAGGEIHLEDFGNLQGDNLLLAGSQDSPAIVDVDSGSAVVLSGHLSVAGSLLGADGKHGGLTVTGDLTRVKIKHPEAVAILDIGSNGVVELNDEGSIIVGIAESQPGKVVIGPGGQLSGSGTIVGDKENDGGVDAFAGSVTSPGSSPGTLTINGDYTAAPGSFLVIEVAGSEADSQHDQIVVTGDVDFRGTVIIKFLEDFAPRAGQEFAFIDARGDNVSIAIEDVHIANLEPGFEFELMSEPDGRTALKAQNDGTFQPSPPAQLELDVDASGNLNLNIAGGAFGDQFEVQHSIDLNDWTRIGSITKTVPAKVRFIAPKTARRAFYRVFR